MDNLEKVLEMIDDLQNEVDDGYVIKTLDDVYAYLLKVYTNKGEQNG